MNDNGMITITELLSYTCKLYDVSVQDVITVRREHRTLIPRLVFINAAKDYGWTIKEISEVLNLSTGSIASALQSKQKSTVLFKRGYNSVSNRIKQ